MMMKFANIKKAKHDMTTHRQNESTRQACSHFAPDRTYSDKNLLPKK